ncbi:hypothetical protein BDZ94DRAFT_1253173 [Collybia nuda]|uniref:Uncharacterized protein n=1 Tax=Collybia nuda TaxID=64659 RepID=A0A9P6CMC0_9AGAR|nr:hypothetical protein BDZ94DRAFT_1253173 [Collybia nuda]
MLSNIEQAVIDLLNQKKPITVPNVFSTYMRIAGIDVNSIDDAVITFERAMDKHAVRPDVIQSPMIVELRNQYWFNKLGGCKAGSGVCHTCESCGGVRLHNRMGKMLIPMVPIAMQVEPRRQDRVRVKSKKNKRVFRKTQAPNPYGPSTSAARL